MVAPVRILIVDDHALFREGLRRMLRDLDQQLEIREAGNCVDALSMAGEPFDLVLLDMHMPGTSGLEALETLRGAFESSRIVVLSGEEDPRVVRRVIDAQAAGYIPKSSTPQVMFGALRLVLADGIYLPAIALRHTAEEPPAGARGAAAALSGRQIDVLRKAVEGKANKVIARELGISEGTVKAHLAAAFRALGVKNRTEAVYAAARSGLHPKT
jgi:DNA-binding NarL/FixJ family response regulator